MLRDGAVTSALELQERASAVSEGVYPNGLPHPPTSLRVRIAVELLVITISTIVFLSLARPDTMLYIGMALIGMGMIGFNAKETRERIWGPPASPAFDRVRRCAINMSILTIPPVIVFFLIGAIGRYWDFTYYKTATSMLSINFILALCLYLPWALLQQTIFQFYLLGRLRALLPFASPLFLSVLNGCAYGLVHVPSGWEMTVVTIIGGIFWSYSYHRDRYVVPIAVSHAVLASTFFYWAYGRDIISEMAKKFAGG